MFHGFLSNHTEKERGSDRYSEPRIPRKRKVPVRYEVGEEPWHPETSEEMYRKNCMKPRILLTINERFDQPSFKAFTKLEALLLKFLKSKDISFESAFVKVFYPEDIKVEFLVQQLEIFKVPMKEKNLECFAEVLEALKSVHHNSKLMIGELITICKLLLVNPATSANGERLFSTARRIKTWLILEQICCRRDLIISRY